ncbi:MAG: RidA family protein [Candidatus Sumerlaeia bacterium]
MSSKSELEFLPSSTPGMPFSEAVRVGNVLYLSGMLPLDASRKVVEGGIVAQTRQVMDNIKAVLEKNGSSLDKVFKMTCMLADMSEWPEMNKVYVTYFSGQFPARSAFGSTGLAMGAKLEIEAVAVVE